MSNTKITRDQLNLWRAKAAQIGASPSGLALSDEDRRLLVNALTTCLDVLDLGPDELGADELAVVDELGAGGT